MNENDTVIEELKEYDRFKKFNIAYLCVAVNTNEDKEKESEGTKLTQRTQLIESLLSQAGNLSSTPETLGSTVKQLYKLKRDLLKIDPDWKFLRSDLGYAAEVATYL
jgi:hypothetical protein